jgi:hypothetical protein
MEALYFGNHAKPGCPGTLPEYPDPWIAVDMESKLEHGLKSPHTPSSLRKSTNLV